MPKFLFRCAKVDHRTRGHRTAGAAVATVLLCLSLAACGGAAPGQGAGGGKPVVLTTFTVLADIAQNVAGDKLQVESITKVGAEIHGYEPTPGDIRKASKADLILDNGLNLEAWFAQFVEDLDVPHAVVSEGVEPIDITEDSYDGKPNPHAWMSPLNVQIYVDNMGRHSRSSIRRTRRLRGERRGLQAELQQ